MKNFNQFEWGSIDGTIKDLLIKETNIGTYEKYLLKVLNKKHVLGFYLIWSK